MAMEKVTVSLNDVKKELAALGYRVTARAFREYNCLTVINAETGRHVNMDTLPLAERDAHHAMHKPYFDWKGAANRSIIDDNGTKCEL